MRFFVEMVGHYSLFMGGAEREDESSVSSPTLHSPSSSSSFQREAFRKAVTSKSLRRFLEVFMETQMFTGFIQERELRRQGLRGTEIRLPAVLRQYSLIITVEILVELPYLLFDACAFFSHNEIKFLLSNCECLLGLQLTIILIID